MRVQFTFTQPAQVQAFKQGLDFEHYQPAPLIVVVNVPAPFDDVGGVRDLLEAVPGPLTWRIFPDEPRPWRPRPRARRSYRRHT